MKKRIIVNGIPKHAKRTAQFFGCKITKKIPHTQIIL